MAFKLCSVSVQACGSPGCRLDSVALREHQQTELLELLTMGKNKNKKTESRSGRPQTPKLKERPNTVDGSSPTKGPPPKVPPKYHRQPSASGNSIKLQRQRSFRKSKEENGSHHSKSPNAYELSSDFQAKQIEMLEKKYGGQLRARIAARTIQQAYRNYCLRKNFQRLRSIKGERRLVHRLTEMGRSDSMWNDIVIHNDSLFTSEYSVDSEGNYNLEKTRKLSDYDNYSPHEASIDKMRETHMADVVMRRIMKIDLETNAKKRKAKQKGEKVGILQGSEEEQNNNRNSYPEQNDSSASDSPQETPNEPLVDLPSVNFENVLETRDTSHHNDSFSNSETSSLSSWHGPSRRTSSEVAYEPLLQHGEMSYENLRSPSMDYSDANIDYSRDGPMRVDMSPGDRSVYPPFLHYGRVDSDQSAMYGNQEVKLRNKQGGKKSSPQESPIWKRKSALAEAKMGLKEEEEKRMSNISETSEPDSVDGGRALSSSGSDLTSMTSMNSDTGSYAKDTLDSSKLRTESPQPSVRSMGSSKVSDKQRKRQYRIGLNLFNKKPEKGMRYLIEHRFVENSARAGAKFLIQRKGLSKQMIGEYLGNLQNQFNQDVLECFVDEIDLSGLQIDVALRTFQGFFRMPGEAQKIERLMEAFARRYCECNPDVIKKFRTTDTVFLLAFAIIMLNTDLHSPNVKQERRMKLPDFIKNLKGIDDGDDVDADLLAGIFERIRQSEFKPGVDHVTQVMKVEQTIVGKKPQLAQSSRRLVCYCRLYEVNDPTKKEKIGLHQREIFLFNDIMVVTKIFAKKKTSITYSFRQSIPLVGTQVYLFETAHYKHGVRLISSLDGKPLITFNARNEHDRTKFVEDLKEAVYEMNEMEAMRIDEEIQKHNRHSSDSGVVDIELLKPCDPTPNRFSAPELKKSQLTNSLTDITDGAIAQRRGSEGSLDSGMVSLSFYPKYL
ncbi:IQ motif and SEC7 domain-containing protein 2-like [Lingula anatina]|uniref:IQ motif and SEC7 domain-containing protein 2-like n=1 Tax=Lingula anatina TaxID=7574 RepID=A0A1S3H9W7_LINAN|nr:IQ motif and SEC7 domain-containing protein 2-like [Lingula anatina]|eukprot:XP_013382812.1 IQ motif and SEC7 domain-containing protein 2-like [Lingula anatina]